MGTPPYEGIPVWPDLVRAVDDNQGIYATNMEKLRLLEGAGRLGPKLKTQLEERFRDLGLGHIPAELPNRADERVVIYRRGSNFGEVMRAIEDGVNGSAGDTLVRVGRRLNALADSGPMVPVDELRSVLKDIDKIIGGVDQRANQIF